MSMLVAVAAPAQSVPPAFTPVAPTGLPYSVIVSGVTLNDEPLTADAQIGVFDGDLCVGAATIGNAGQIVITTWKGDDALAIPGFVAGNAIGFRIRTSWFSEIQTFEGAATVLEGGDSFGDGHFSLVAVAVTTTLAPEVSVNPVRLEFGQTDLGIAVTREFTVANDGDAILQVPAIVTDHLYYLVSPTSMTLAPTESQTVTVTFNPAAAGGFSAHVTVHSDDPGTPAATVDLVGIGLPPPRPELAILNDTVTFGQVAAGRSRTRDIRLANQGNADLVIHSITSNGSSFSVGAPTSFTMPSKSSRSAPITYAPSAAGQHSATITINSNDGAAAIAVSGEATPGHFADIPTTGIGGYSIIIDRVDLNKKSWFEPGDEIGVFDGETLVGVGGVGNALQLDGIDDHVQVADSNAFDLPGAVTIECRIRAGSVDDGVAGIIGKGRNYGLFLHPDRRLELVYRNGAGREVRIESTAGALPADQWHHIAGVIDVAASTMTIYVDGAPVASGVAPENMTTNSDPLTIGAASNNVSQQFLPGLVDEVRVWNVARSQADIDTNKAMSIRQNQSGLVASWTFDDGTLRSSVSGQYTGTFAGGARLAATNALPHNNVIFVWQRHEGLGLDGYTPGNPISFRLWSNLFGVFEELDAAPEFIIGDGHFGTGTLSVVRLSAVSDSEPNIAVDIDSLYLGQLPIHESVTSTVSITNSGNTPLTILSISETSTVFSLTHQSATVQPDETLDVIATFSPVVPGTHGTTMTIVSNDPDEPVIDVDLSGFGLPAGRAEISLSTASVNFGGVVIGESETKIFRIANTGTAPLTVTGISSGDPSFVATPNAFTLTNTNDVQDVSVVFSPGQRRSFSDILSITSNADTRSLAVTGIGFDGHFPAAVETGLPYQIVIDNTTLNEFLTSGDEIGVYDGDRIVGRGVVPLFGNSLSLDGNGDLVDVADDNVLDGMLHLTLEAWVYLNNTGHQGIIRKQNSYALSIRNGTIQYGPGTQWTWFNTGIVPPTGRWFHIAAVWDGQVEKFFIDGKKRGSTLNFTDGAIPDTAGPVHIGFDDNGWYLNGLIDDVRVWNVIRSEDEIHDNMNRELTGLESGLVGYWKFNGDALDHTPFQNHGVQADNAMPFGPPAIQAFESLQVVSWERIDESADDGFTPGNPIGFKVWTTINGYPSEFDAVGQFSAGDGTFGYGRYAVAQLTVATPQLTVTPTELFNPIEEPASVARTLTVENTGDETLVYDIILRFTDPASPPATWLEVSQTSGTLEPGVSETIDVTLSTAGLNDGLYQAELEFTGNTPTPEPVVVPVRINVTGNPQIDVSDAAIAFGSVEVGQSASRTLTISNIGTDALDITAIDVQDGAILTLDHPGDLPIALEPAATLAVTVVFAPAAAGDITDRIAIASNAENAPTLEVPVTGTGLTPPDLTIATTAWSGTYDADTVNADSITFSNEGQSPVDFTISGAVPWLAVTPTASTMIAAGESLDVALSISTIGLVTGTYTGSLTVASNDPDEPEIALSFTLTVVGAPRLAVADSLDFPATAVGAERELPLTLANTGSDTLLVSSVTVSHPVFSVDFEPTLSIAPGTSSAVPVVFTPAADGNFQGILEITSNSADAASHQIALRGAGFRPPDIAVSPESIALTLPTGTQDTVDLTVSNTGSFPLTYEIAPEASGKTALSLDRAGEFVKVRHHPSLDIEDALTLEAWINLRTGQDQVIVAKESDAIGPWRLWVNGGGNLEFQLNVNRRVTSAEVVPVDQWTHVAATFDGAALRLYIDGELSNEAVYPLFSINRNNDDLRIGRAHDGTAFDGLIDELRIWNRTRDPSEIQALRNQSLKGTEDGLVLYFTFDSDGGNAAVDTSLQGNNGTYFGGAARTASTAPINAFLVVTPLGGAVEPAMTATITVEIDSAGLASNLYSTSLSILSDDPDESVVAVPISLTVTGQGLVRTEPTQLDFPDTAAGITTTASLTVFNDGSDALNIFDWELDSAAFATSASPLTILPFSSRSLTVFFTPTAAGLHEDILTIVSDASNTDRLTVALSGTGTEPATIAVAPASIDAALDFDQSTIDTLDITNTGGSVLDYSIVAGQTTIGGRGLRFLDGVAEVANPGGFDAQTLTVEAWVRPEHADNDEIPAVFVRADRFNAQIFALRMWTGSIAGSTAGAGYEVVVNNVGSGPIPFPFAAGQWVHLALAFSVETAVLYVNGSPVLSLPKTLLSYADADAFMIGNDPTGNRAFTGAVDEVRIWSATRSAAELNAGRTAPLTGDEDGLVAYYPFTGGLVNDRYVIDASPRNNLLAVSGDVVISTQSPAPVATAAGAWLGADPSTGAVAAGLSQSQSITIDATGLHFGSHADRLIVISNDAANGVIDIPVTLTVSAPRVELSTTGIDFGDIAIGAQNTRTLNVWNTGNRPLIITGYTLLDAADFTHDGAADATLAPDEQLSLAIVFAPGSLGTFTDRLTISTNIGDHDIALLGISHVPLPDIRVEPTELNVETAENTVLSRFITITNDGEADLTADVAAARSWISIDPASAEIMPTLSRLVTVDIDTTGILPGDYAETLEITSNDLDAPTILVPITIDVGPDPELQLGQSEVAVTLSFGGTTTVQLDINNTGAGSLGYTLTESVDWLSIGDPTGIVPGNSSASVGIAVAAGALRGGHHDAVIIIDSNAGNVTVPVRLSVAEPALADNLPPAVTVKLFPDETDTATIAVSNEGLAPLNLDLTGFASTGWLTIDTPQRVVAPGATDSVILEFNTEGQEEGSRLSAVVQITHDDPGRISPIALTANLDVYRFARFSAADVNQDVGYQPGETITLTAALTAPNGSQTVTVTSELTDAANASLAVVTDTVNLAPGSANGLTTALAIPESGVAHGIAQLVVVASDTDRGVVQDTQTIDVPVGVPVPEVSEDTIDFSDILAGAAASRELTISNTGDLTLTPALSPLTPPYSATLSSDRVAPGDTAAVTVTFAPTVTGDFTAQLVIRTNAGDVPVSLSGTSVESNIAVTPNSLFEVLGFGQTSIRALNISNTGNGALTWTFPAVDENAAANGLRLDETAGHFSVPAMDGVAFDALTVEAWIYPQPQQDETFIVSQASSTALADGFALHADHASAMLRFTVSGTLLETSLAFPEQRWSHVAGTFDGAAIRLYVNGLQVGGPLARNQPVEAAPAPLVVGAGPDLSGNWRGMIDQVRIWHTARTPEQLAATMRVAAVGASAELAGYWTFDENGDDSSGLARHGVFSGGAAILPSAAPLGNQWFSVSSRAGSVPPGETVVVHAVFRTLGNTIRFSRSLVIRSNDPQTPQLVIPVSLDVENLDAICEEHFF